MRDGDVQQEPRKRISYSTELAREFCTRMLDRGEHGGPRSVLEICADDDMPAERTVYMWLREHDDFMQMYTRAREDQAHLAAAQIIDIADTENDPAKARNRIDARKWYASKLNAKHYGDKVENTMEVGATLGSLLGKLTGAVVPDHAVTSALGADAQGD